MERVEGNCIVTTSQDMDLIALSRSAASSLCLAIVLTATPAIARPSHTSALESLTKQPRFANFFTGSSSTEAASIAEVQQSPAEQLVKLFSDLSGERDVPLMAHICNVSKNTYYGWLQGESVGANNQERLARTIELLGDVASRHQDIIAFLKASTDIGQAADQLRAGRFDVVLGMSYGVTPAFSGRTARSGRPIRSVPFSARAATPERLRNARRVRDVVDEPNVEVYIESTEDLGSAALGSAIIVG
jgi:hypothetical protein